MIDLHCGQLICEAVMAALIARRTRGKPQYVEMTMLGGATSLLMTRLAEHLRGGQPPTHRTRHSAPDALYSTADGAVAVTVENDEGFRSLCAAIDRPELADEQRFATADARLANIEALDGELQRTFADAPSDWWLVALGRARVACARVHSDHEASAHRDTWRRGHLREIAVRDAGRLLAAAPPWDFADIEPVHGRAPRPGEHTELLRKDAASFWPTLEREQR
jgi:crotonobetainyl-CoA:carnitine CoA-transferase CaiB-like acyl-CoA transferase